MNQKPFETRSEHALAHAERIAPLRAQATSLNVVHFVPGDPCGCAVLCLALFTNRGRTLLYDGPETILSVCDAHAAAFGCYDTTGAGRDNIEPLYAELINSHGHALTVECGCRLAFHSDDRATATTGVCELTPVEHPHETIRCDAHAHLTDCEAHHAAIVGQAA